MSALSAYQQMRRANLGENRQFLMEYGLEAPVVDSSLIIEDPKEETKKPVRRVEKKSRPVKPNAASVERRSSFRIRLRVHSDQFEDYESLKDSDEEDEAELLQNLRRPQKIPGAHRPNTYGSIEGVKVGTWWETRLECNYDGIHRPTVAGIHPGPDGAYSVALSGGYEDDVDLGDSFTYTGEGGRDLKGTATNPKNLRTAPQSKHQTLTRGNLALTRNVETGNPVRVIRGYKLKSKFAPERGYRYDGLYRIDRFWETVGKAGYRIFKFDFVRCDPEPAPWNKLSPQKRASSADESDSSMDENKSSKTQHQMSTNDSEDGRETLFFELSPGKITPVKVARCMQDLQNCSISCPDMGWHGWDENGNLPKSDCLSVECEGVKEQVRLIEEKWQTMPLPPMSLGEPVSVCFSSKIEDICNPIVISDKGHSNNDDDGDWLGWQEERTPGNHDILAVDYQGCIARICLREGQWQEVNSYDLPAGCGNSDGSSRIIQSSTKEPLNSSTSVVDNKSSKTPNEMSNDDSEEGLRTQFLELSPGKKMPVKVVSCMQGLQECSISCPDMGWHGWDENVVLPKSDCLIVEFNGVKEQVCLVEEKWQTMPLPPMSQGEPVSVCFSSKIEDICNPIVISDKGHSNNDDDGDWLGWQEECTPGNYDTLSVKYQGCTARICLQKGEWQEVNLNDLPVACENSDASSRIIQSSTKEPLNSSTYVDENKSSETPNQISDDDSEDGRKTLFLELSPGKKTPVKVVRCMQDLQNCSISCPDMGWHGWDKNVALPKSDCLTVECDGVKEQVRLVEEKWQTPLPSINQSETLSVCSPFKTVNIHNPIIISDIGCSKDEDWLGWQEECTPGNHDTLAVDYQGCIVRICLRAGEWQEVNSNDLFAVCVGSDAGSRISWLSSKK